MIKKKRCGKLYIFVTSLILLLLCGFTVMYLWNLFIAGTFNVPQITFVQAMGVDLFVSFIATLKVSEEKTDEEYARSNERAIHFTINTIIAGWILGVFL